MRKLWVQLLCAAMVLALATAALQTRQGESFSRSAAGVALDCGLDEPVALGELTEVEVTEKVAQLADLLREQPTEPMVDSVTKGVIPGLAGRELDQAATVAKIMSATGGSLLQPELRHLQPKSLWDYSEYPVYQGNPAKQQIALVINVAWGNAELLEMLDILAEADVRASFFLVGRWAAKNPDLVQQIAAAGHEFGNHAYSDPHLPKLSPPEIAAEITRTSEVITQITGQSVRFFSPPYNDFNQSVLDTAADLGYLTVLCSLDTADWMRPGVSRIVQRIVPRAHAGAIVLMHPTEQTPAALKPIIDGLRQQGYELVPVSELLAPVPGGRLIAPEA